MGNVIAFNPKTARVHAFPPFDRALMIATHRKPTGDETRNVVAGKTVTLSADFNELTPHEQARALHSIDTQTAASMPPEI